MYNFEYLRPSDLGQAARAAEDGDARFLSGGMTLLPTMKQRLVAPTQLIDLTALAELKGIDRRPDGTLRIKGCTVHADVAASDVVKKFCPALAFLAGNIGDQAVRHRGTVGGSVANNDPAADFPSAVLALDAVVVTDRREIAADDFFAGLFETALADGEFVTAIDFKAPVRAGYAKFPNPASRYAMAGVFVAKFAESVRVAVTGAGSGGVFRWHEAEQALSAAWSSDALEAIALVPEEDLMSDIHARADYRAALVKVMARRAVQFADRAVSDTSPANRGGR